MIFPSFFHYLRDIRRRLGDYRYRHSLCVAESAKVLAVRYGGDPGAAYAAGILHDVWKEASKEESLAFFRSHGVTLTAVEAASPMLWHAMAGAIYIRETYDPGEEIVSAVRWHTTGRAGMTLAEKILFTADFISEDRDYPGVEDMRRRAEVSLTCAMAEGLRFTINDLSEQGRAIHPDTLFAYNEIILEERKQHG